MKGKRLVVMLIASVFVFGILNTASPVLAGTRNHQRQKNNRPWMNQSLSPDKRADLLLKQMTLKEKAQMMHGIRTSDHYRYIPPIPRLGVPAIKMNNGPAGVSSGGVTQYPATALPAPVSVAASWEPSLGHLYGVVQAKETKDLGRNLLEGPDVNIMRVPRNGRTFESYGEDPYLTSKMAVSDIKGIQSQNVIATVKHYIANNQEHNRFTVNADVGQRALREIYLPAFKAAVKQARVGSVMCAYNKVNSIYSCQNQDMLDNVLKGQFGFKGLVMSDWGATHSTIPSLKAGLDMEMPTGNYYTYGALKQALDSGQISMANINEHVHRILRTMFRFGLFDRSPQKSPINVKKDGEIARHIAEQGTVLLKNQNHQLPLSKSVKSIAVIGPEADQAMTGGGGSSQVKPLYKVSPLEGIKKRAGSDVKVRFARGDYSNQLPVVPSSYLTPSGAKANVHGLKGEYFNNDDFSGSPVLQRTDSQVNFDYGTGSPAPGVNSDHFSVRWTGTITVPKNGEYSLGLTSDDGSKLYLNHQLIIDNSGDHSSKTKTKSVSLKAGKAYNIKIEYHENTGNASISFGLAQENAIQQAANIAKSSDVAVVFVGDHESEGHDRDSLSLSGNQDQLISAVAKANKHTIVVLRTGGPVLMPWVNQVPSVLEAWYPGEEDGNAIASVLFGDVNPSGKLPMTFPKNASDVPANTTAQYPGSDGVAHYSEGIFVGYRHYDKDHIKPLYPFGYGLSYTTFHFSHLKITPKGPKAEADRKVSLDVTNTGSRAGAEVVQLYLGIPDNNAPEPPKQLKRFKKVNLLPGETKRVTFRLNNKALSYWDTKANKWVEQNGDYHVMIGSSSRDIRLQNDFKVKGASGPRYTTLQSPSIMIPGATETVKTTFTNGGSVPAHHVNLKTQLPNGWSAKAITKSFFKTVGAGQSVKTSWKVTVPANAKPGNYDLNAVTTYHGKGGGRVRGSTTTKVAYPSLKSAFNNVGISPNSNPSAADFAGSGTSYSKEALADAGVKAGSTVDNNGFSFTWPNLPIGQPDNVIAGGQAIKISGKGKMLGFIGASAFGTSSGKGKIVYDDGSTQSFTLTFADWYANEPASGDQLVATTSSWNHPQGTSAHKVSIYSSAVPLSDNKTVKAVVLPNISPNVGDGITSMHIFSMAIK